MFNIKILFLLFLTYSFLGWVMEMIVTVIEDKEIVNRGFLVGPYCPIYGVCSIAMILLLNKVTNPVLLFVLSIIICSVGEYLTSYILEKIFNARWWDYSNMKFNLNGRICLRNCFFFGLLGFLVLNYINNYFANIYLSLNPNTLNIIFYSLLTIFLVDLIISCNVLLKIKNMSLKYINLDNTKEISIKVKDILTKNFLSRRLLKAFPYLMEATKKGFKKIKNRVRSK